MIWGDIAKVAGNLDDEASPRLSEISMIKSSRVPFRLLLLAFCFGCHEPSALTSNASSQSEEDARRASEVQAMAIDYESKLPPVPQISASDLLERPIDGLLLVDCRSQEERAVSTLPGAIAHQRLEERPEDYRESEIVVYCTIGYRSSKLVGELRAKGFTASNLRGGVLAWAHAGGEFIDAGGSTTAEVHVYDAPWDLLPSDYQSQY